MSNIEITNEDNMLLMARYPDNYFDLAIVDPPYGLNIAKSGSNGNSLFNAKDWDLSIPNDKYYLELFRVTKNQIIWGGNYMPILWNYGGKEFIFWNKLNHHDNRADGELAWTSFNGLAKYFEYMWDGNRYGFKGCIKGVGQKSERIHPTQKPVALYKWLLDKYAKQGDKILDTHLGSGSIAIACHDYGFDLTACELDKDYYEKALDRLKKHQMQQKLF